MQNCDTYDFIIEILDENTNTYVHTLKGHPLKKLISLYFQCSALYYWHDKYVLGKCYIDGIFYPGNDVRYIEGIESPDQCLEACYKSYYCDVWSYKKNEQKCYLKTTFGDRTNILINNDYISGSKACNGKAFKTLIGIWK